MPEEKDKKTLKLKEDKKEVKKDGKKEVKKEGAKKRPKFNLIQKWREMVAELKKVTWPSRKELIRHSIVVVVFVVLITAVIAVYDLALSSLIKLII